MWQQAKLSRSEELRRKIAQLIPETRARRTYRLEGQVPNLLSSTIHHFQTDFRFHLLCLSSYFDSRLSGF